MGRVDAGSVWFICECHCNGLNARACLLLPCRAPALGVFPDLDRGNVPALWLWCTYSAVQFPVYRQVRHMDVWRADRPQLHQPPSAASLPPRRPSSLDNALAGAVASSTATFLTYPLDVLRTTLAGQGTPAVRQKATECVGAPTRCAVRAHQLRSCQRQLALFIARGSNIEACWTQRVD